MNRLLQTMCLGLLCVAFRAAWADDDAIVLKGAVQNHPHIQSLLHSRIKVEGCHLYLSTRTLSALQSDLDGAAPWDLLEVDVMPFLTQFAAGKQTEYILIPVFLSRQFQMRTAYIRTDRNISQPSDLRGKTIGVDGYAGTTPTWVRGVLQSSFSIKPEEITWLDIQTSTGPAASLSDWLTKGKVDAIFTPVPPQAYLDKNPLVDRLFEDSRLREQETFQKSRIFPIQTAVAVRKTLIQENPWLSEALFMAFSKAKANAYADLTLPLPWGGDQLSETQEIMGKNYWSYGIKSNPKTLGALFNYANSQGLLAKQLSIDDVFDASTLELIEP